MNRANRQTADKRQVAGRQTDSRTTDRQPDGGLADSKGWTESRPNRKLMDLQKE